jgi:DNA-binding GntR family transcriptional regulator
MEGAGRTMKSYESPNGNAFAEREDDLQSTPREQSAMLAVVNYVHQAISEGRLLPGQRVRERELAEACSVSRSAVREALRTLATEGTLTVTHGRGATVRQYTREEFWANHQIREVLEGLAAYHAACRIDDVRFHPELTEIISRLDDCAARDDREAYLQANYEFHDLIVRMSGNPFIQDHLDRTLTMPLRSQAARFASEDSVQRSHIEHQAVIDAILAGDPIAAERAMRRHIIGTRKTILAIADSLFQPLGGKPSATEPVDG